MKEALFYNVLKNNKVKCHLCPHECVISHNNTGICRVRKNKNGKLLSLVYGQPVAIHFDPVEKKPLYHFYPGKDILSIGTAGCNLQCFFCQNSTISQSDAEEYKTIINYPEDIIRLAQTSANNIGVAYTYNEPVVFYEYMFETAALANKCGLKNVMISNGFINSKPLKELLPFMDAFNIDLKAFNDSFYKKHTHSRLSPVLETIKTIRLSGKHIEITHLVIPGLNDDYKEFSEMLKWIMNETGKDTVLHLSRYFPRYRSSVPPTPSVTLLEMFHMAKDILSYVYIGNSGNNTGSNTLCPFCGSQVIGRSGYMTDISGLDINGGFCKKCRKRIIDNI